MSKDKTFKTFRFPVSKAPEKIDREIREWAEKNGMKELERSNYTTFPLEGKYYLICVSKFEMKEEDAEEELEDMFD